MDADLARAQEKKTVSLSVSDLRARLDGKSQPTKDDPDQDESSKSSIRSLNSSFEMPKEEMTSIMKRINQFQAHNVPIPAPSSKSSLAHSRTGSSQPVPAAASNPSAEVASEPSSNGAAEPSPKGPKKFQKTDSSDQSPAASPSVAALRSQLGINPAMLRPGEPGRVKTGLSLSGQSADPAETTSNTPTVEIPKTPPSSSGPTSSSLRASSRVSDIQQRLALDPNMLLPSPLSGPPSRGHRRGKSTAVPTPTPPVLDVSNETQLNRPLIASKARRSGTSAKFACDDESSQVLEEIEQMAMRLDGAAAKALLVQQQDAANREQSVTIRDDVTLESIVEQTDAKQVPPSIHGSSMPVALIEQSNSEIGTRQNQMNSIQATSDVSGMEQPSRNRRHRTMDSGVDVLEDIELDLKASVEALLQLITTSDEISERHPPNTSESDSAGPPSGVN